MAVAIADLREVTDDRDPGSVNLSIKGGKAKMSYYWTSTNVADFSAMATLIYGSADLGSGLATPNAGINRKAPLAHPRFPSLYAETITNFAGMGGQFLKEASAAVLTGAGTASHIPQYARYPEYQIDIEFSNRLYPVVDNTYMLWPPTTLTWQDDMGTGANITRKCWDAFEYQRHTWITGGPKENLLTAKQGQMVMEVFDPVAGAMNTIVFPDMPKMPIPDGTVVIKWFEVPYSFVRPTSPIGGMSWFQRFQGRVNQLQFLNWAPGQLLYVTINPKPYNAPIPDSTGKIIRLCDIDIICLETSRILSAGDTPQPQPWTAGQLSNWIPAGFNLQPWWKDRQFHYAHVGNLASAPAGPPTQIVATSLQTPSWKSFPFQMLFTNPEFTLPAGG